jgi:TFIIF-interacting CTD phosphatase-like protein
MIQEDRIEKVIFGFASFKNIPKKIIDIIEKSKKIQSVLKNNKWYIGKL